MLFYNFYVILFAVINMEKFTDRTQMMFSEDGIEKLKNSHVAVFGVGGVGTYVCEALARAGVGTLDLIDNDTVAVSNINRQLVALNSTLGKLKADVMKERILDINPEATVNTFNCFFLPENSADFDFSQYDYVVDAIDTVKAKIELAVCCDRSGTRLISSMGTGNKIHPELFEIADINKTSVCPLARVMRLELKKRGIKHLKVLYSKETPFTQCEGRTPASNSFTPSAAGLIIAGEVIRDLLELN